MNEEGGGASRSTDPAAGTSSATDVSLREYLVQAINESRRECRENIKHLERRFDEGMKDIDRRFDGVNEFRGSLEDLSRLMATKDNLARVEEKFEASNAAQSARVSALERRIDLREGQEVGSKLTIGNLVVAVTVLIAVLGLVVVAANYFSGP